MTRAGATGGTRAGDAVAGPADRAGGELGRSADPADRAGGGAGPGRRIRRARMEDAEALARGVVEGVADYPEFAPPGWTAPPYELHLPHVRELLASRHVTCLVAEEADGALVGQVAFLPAARAPHAVDDAVLGHVSNLFVRRDRWGAGVARELHAAALGEAARAGFRALRLFVAAGQTRARRFYEREGWSPAGEPFHDPVPGLEMVEYRRPLP